MFTVSAGRCRRFAAGSGRVKGRQYGIAQIGGLVAICIFTTGVPGIAALQLKLLQQSTNAQTRMQASYLAEELVSLAAADRANASWYAITAGTPATCTATVAKSGVSDWLARAQAALPQASSNAPTTTYRTDGTFRVTLYWQRPHEAMLHNLRSVANLYP